MYLSDEPLHISIDVVDTLFSQVLCDSIAQTTPPDDTWKHIEQIVKHFPAQRDFKASL